ncbi:serine/threonine-protein kinase [Planotetraspora kaengkrachanensis]|uniref:non-specific serine/threonine protein kinase n=1 Tax=Planotetraspora kaengkrachanensis TaxID=575193 RepID=A0A8J3LS17_9ACTN|nr:serine/threonine-protein kinase [Planotetraspora kaengkrachanensis]GIG77017.1 serine/threonine protein kinase [Planotetraspora kaengkrachanensis]
MNEGRRIAGRYRLLEAVGRGGMGIVWRAHDEVLDRTVAVKEVLNRAVTDEEREEFNRRTIREARAAGRLSHSSVVVVHDVIEEDGRPWIVMQFVQARSLGSVLLEDGPLPPRRVAAIGLQVLGALRAAHAAGILHRDVKPENVLLRPDGSAVLTDFGIATMPDETGFTSTGMVSGTPAFLPPERLNGRPATRESDLWSLGATIYTAVEGRPPFERDSAIATMAAVIHTEPDPPRHAGPLTPVIEGLLVKEPARRMAAGTAERLLKAAAGADDAGARSGPGAHARARSGSSTGIGARSGQATGNGAAPPPGATSVLAPERRAARRGPRAHRRAASPARVAVAGLLCAVLATGGWYGYRRLGGDTATGSASGPVASATAPTVPSPAASAAGPGTAPEGWTTHVDPLGFSVALPKGWSAFDRQATRVSFHDSSRSGYLLVDLTKWTAADPVEALTDVEVTARKKGLLPGYKRIRLGPVREGGTPAAEWEFTYTPSYGRVRVLDHAFRLPDGRFAALYWQTTDRTWTTTMSYFRVFLTTFMSNE